MFNMRIPFSDIPGGRQLPDRDLHGRRQAARNRHIHLLSPCWRELK